METDDELIERVAIEQEPQISAVELRHVEWYWPRVRDWILAALQESVLHELSEAEIYRACLKGEYLMLVLAIGDSLCGVAVLTASKDPMGRNYMAVICCGGIQVHRWLGLLVNTCRLLAHDIGAREIILMGRPGWRAMLAPMGLKLRAVVMVLDLEKR